MNIYSSPTCSADYFQVPLLTEYCYHNMRTRILSASNALSMLVQLRHADYPNAGEAQLVCFDYIDAHPCEVLDGPIRAGKMILCNEGNSTACHLPQELNAQLLGELLTRDSLKIAESDLFAVVVAWVGHECQRKGRLVTGENMRTALGDILFGVRFPLMSTDFFENRVGTSN
jgi:BTB And C-terminal Kelch